MAPTTFHPVQIQLSSKLKWTLWFKQHSTVAGLSQDTLFIAQLPFTQPLHPSHLLQLLPGRITRIHVHGIQSSFSELCPIVKDGMPWCETDETCRVPPSSLDQITWTCLSDRERLARTAAVWLRPGAYCQVTFEGGESSLKKSLQMTHGKWEMMASTRAPTSQEVESFVNEAIQKYDHWYAAQRQAKGPIVDEDGFTLVTRLGRRNANKATDADGKAVIYAADKNMANAQPKSHSKQDFYRAQMKQARKEQVLQLREKFEQDKKRLARQQRAFKPY